MARKTNTTSVPVKVPTPMPDRETLLKDALELVELRYELRLIEAIGEKYSTPWWTLTGKAREEVFTATAYDIADTIKQALDGLTETQARGLPSLEADILATVVGWKYRDGDDYQADRAKALKFVRERQEEELSLMLESEEEKLNAKENMRRAWAKIRDALAHMEREAQNGEND